MVVGLDIGTSSLKLVILNTLTNNVELELKKSTSEARILSENKLFYEQDVEIIWNLAKSLINEIPKHLSCNIKAWQLCGQVKLTDNNQNVLAQN
jgi:sugar (pentulose or hexulose) kinase